MGSTAKNELINTIAIEDDGIGVVAEQSNLGRQDSQVQNDENATAPDQHSSGTNLTRPKRKSTRAPSQVWEHFTKVSDDASNPRAKCNHCGTEYACGSKKNGTSNLLNHIANQCKKYGPNKEKKQKILSFQDTKEGGGCVTHTYNPEKIREAICKMVIKDELPFNFVEGERFKELLWTIEPRFKAPSRSTTTRDCMKLYLDEKKQLKNMFVKTKQRVCLTTDAWTSCQNLHYVCLTGHFIDENWILHKRILNYYMIPNGKGETLGKAIEQCLLEWGIERVFTVTVDNASSNNVCILYIAKIINEWGGGIMRSEHMHMRCAAHILNLILQEAFTEYDQSIKKIRDVVRYVRSSPARLKKINERAEQAKLNCKKTICLDVATHWNSTYLMLDVAEKYQKAFERMESHDVAYVKEFCNSLVKTCPTDSDWEKARMFTKFLKIVYDATLRFSGTNYVTSNKFLDQISFIHSQLDFWSENGDHQLGLMADSMKKKYEKYWGKIEDINPLLLVAVLLDPRYKEPFLTVCFEMCGCNFEEAARHTRYVRNTLERMYKEYSGISNSTQHCSSTSMQSSEDNGVAVGDVVDAYTLFQNRRKERLKAADNLDNKTELDKYLVEACEDIETSDFDILSWWKVNSGRYKILSLIALDVLAIPVSTVASESAFSTDGRVIDPYRSCLSPKTVQALICTQNWIRRSPIVDSLEAIEEAETIESDVLSGVGDIRID